MGFRTLKTFSAVIGALRQGPPFHGSRSYREIKIQNESCRIGGGQAAGDKTASFCSEPSRSCREINQHPSPLWNFMNHGRSRDLGRG